MTTLMSEANERVFREMVRDLEAAGRSARTIEAYHFALLSLQRHLAYGEGGTDLLAVRKHDVTGWLRALQETHAADSVVSYYTSARRFYNWAVAEEVLPASPFARVTPPSPSGKPVAVPDPEDLRRLLKACEGKGIWELRDTAIIRLFCETGGPRLSEVALLELGQVDLAHDYVTVNGKTGWRGFPLSARTARALSRYLRARDRHPLAAETGRLWLAPKGPLTPNGIGQMVRRRAREAGIPHLHPHQLRHYAAHTAKAAGMSDQDVMVLHGWSTTRMLARYGAALSGQRAADASRRLALGNQL